MPNWLFDSVTLNEMIAAEANADTGNAKASAVADVLRAAFPSTSQVEITQNGTPKATIPLAIAPVATNLKVEFPVQSKEITSLATSIGAGQLGFFVKNGTRRAQAETVGFTDTAATISADLIEGTGAGVVGPVTFTLPDLGQSTTNSQATGIGGYLAPDPPPSGSWTLNNPTESIRQWLHDDPNNPVWWPHNAVGHHISTLTHGDNQWTATPPFQYGADRAHDIDTSINEVATQWARLNPNDGVYDWRGLDEWIDRTVGKTRCFVLMGTPPWAQKYASVPWGYGYIQGGGIPPRAGLVKRFVEAMYAHLLEKYGVVDLITFFEVWNEPRVYEADASLDSRYTDVAQTKFFHGSANDLADIAIEIDDGLPANAALVTAGAWEGKTDYSNPNRTLFKFTQALINKGKLGVIKCFSYHNYVYYGPGNWDFCVTEATRYHEAVGALGYTEVLLVINTEQGAEYSDGTGANGSLRLSDYSDTDQANWVERILISQLALGTSIVYFYNYRVNDKWFGYNKPLTNARLTQMHNRGGSWIYRAGVTNSNKLYYSMLDQDGNQINRLL